MCAALLVTEIIYTRIFSVFYHASFLFVILSVAMLGLGMAGTAIYVLPKTFKAEKKDTLLYLSSILFCISIFMSLRLNLFAASIPYDANHTPTLGALIINILSTAMPFLFGGIYVTLNITFFKKEIGRYYFADLLGAGFGCLLAILLINRLGVFEGLLFSPCLALVAALVISAKNRSVGGLAVAALLMALSVTLSLANKDLKVFSLTHAKGRALERNPVYEDWTPLGRITAPTGDMFLIDEFIKTVIPKIEKPGDVETVKYSVMSTAYHLKKKGKVLIIGPGGGIDLVRAYWARSDEVTGVEINPGIVKAMQGPLKSDKYDIYTLPGVTVHCQEGRNFVNQSKEAFDIIQISFIDTYAAAATGSAALVENTLYTAEAFDAYWKHLEPDGFLTMARWGGNIFGTCEMERVAAMAVEMLLRHGIKDPSRHIVSLRNPSEGDLKKGVGYNQFRKAQNMASLLVKKSPFTKAEIAKIQKIAKLYKFRKFHIPGDKDGHAALKQIITAASFNQLRFVLGNLYKKAYFDLTPPTDEKPFFFSMINPFDFDEMERQKPDWRKSLVNVSKYVGVDRIRRLINILLVMSVVFILVPLLARRERNVDFISAAPMLLYFVALGLGFMFIEVATINRFTLLLGYPTYSLTVVLFSALLSSGLGSLLFERLTTRRYEVIVLAIVCTGIVFWQLHPCLIQRYIEADFFTRAMVSIASIAILFFPMGMALPLGIRVLTARANALIPWAFALNGVFSVTGTVFAMVLNFQGGFSLTYIVGVVCYLFAAACLLGQRIMASRA
jgi:hypothetical protein